MLCATALQSGQTTLPACAAKQVISSPWGAPLLGLPKPVADSHAKDAPRQIPSNFRTSPQAAPKRLDVCLASISFRLLVLGACESRSINNDVFQLEPTSQ